MVQMMKLLHVSSLAVVAFGKELVPTAHPFLKERFAKNGGRITMKDIADAQKEAPVAEEVMETNRKSIIARQTLKKANPKRIGSVNDDITEAQCDIYTNNGGDSCSQGGLDDDLPVALGYGSCATCGYMSYSYEMTELDCLTCTGTDVLIVLYDDCTGVCAPGDAYISYALLGLATMANSACDCIDACYDDNTCENYEALGWGSYAYYIDDDDDDDDGAAVTNPMGIAAAAAVAAAAYGAYGL